MEYVSHAVHELSLLRKCICATSKLSSAERLRVTMFVCVEALSLFIVIEPVGAVVSSFMSVKTLGDSSLPATSTLQYSSLLFAPSVRITG